MDFYELARALTPEETEGFAAYLLSELGGGKARFCPSGDTGEESGGVLALAGAVEELARKISNPGESGGAENISGSGGSGEAGLALPLKKPAAVTTPGISAAAIAAAGRRAGEFSAPMPDMETISRLAERDSRRTDGGYERY